MRLRGGEREGLNSWADECLIKPFTALDLVAQVGSQRALTKTLPTATRHRAEADLQQRNLTALLIQAPMPICTLRGPRLVVELAIPSPAASREA